jgi:hypothetical protein
VAHATCICGAVLEPSLGRRPRKYCSKKCTRAAYYRSVPADESKQCSSEGCQRRAVAKGMCQPHRSGLWRQEQAAKGISRKRYPSNAKSKACIHCGSAFKTTTSATRYCKDCFKKQRWKSTRSHELVVYTGPVFVRKPKINKNPIPRSKRKFKSGSCKTCGTWFITLNMDVTCSLKCQKAWQKKNPSAVEAKRVAKDRRRARKRNAFVENVYRKKVFEADGYRCHLCNQKTDPTKKVPHPRSPTLDHIIPLAAGGTHEPSNCRTACFLCNALKGDRGGGEQLLLIG